MRRRFGFNLKLQKAPTGIMSLVIRTDECEERDKAKESGMVFRSLSDAQRKSPGGGVMRADTVANFRHLCASAVEGICGQSGMVGGYVRPAVWLVRGFWFVLLSENEGLLVVLRRAFAGCRGWVG